MNKLMLIITLTAAMAVCADEIPKVVTTNTEGETVGINAIEYVSSRIRDMTPAKIEELKTEATKTLAVYCDWQLDGFQYLLATAHLKAVNESDQEAAAQFDRFTDNFMRRCSWMLE